MNERPEEQQGNDRLVEAAFTGDEGAFRQLYYDMQGTLGAVVYNVYDKHTMVKEGVSDLIQDAFAKVWEKRDQLVARTLAGFQAWLIAIVQNLARDKQNRHRSLKRDIDKEEAIEQGSDEDRQIPASEKSSRDQDAINAVWDALNRLPGEQREAIRLQKFEGWTLAQIAQKLNCTQSKVQGLLRRGKGTLAGLLKQYDVQEESDGQ